MRCKDSRRVVWQQVNFIAEGFYEIGTGCGDFARFSECGRVTRAVGNVA